MSAPCPVFGIAVHFLPATQGDDARRALVAEWRGFVEGLGLRAHLATGSAFDFVVTGEAMQATDADRLAVERWLRQRGDLVHWSVGDLRDLHED